jgi:hypothetical protein
MKKLLLTSLIVLLAFSGCKKDKEDIKQIEFTLTNMTTLMGKSQDYIKDASPGVYDESLSETDFLFFNYDEIGVVGNLVIAYDFVENKCDGIIMLGESEELDAADYLMSMAEDEFGTGVLYNLSYYDDAAVLQEETFTTYEDLWLFVDDFLLTASDIESILGGYIHGDQIIIAGGMTLEGFFWPAVNISSSSSKKSTSRQDLLESIRRLCNSGVKKPA